MSLPPNASTSSCPPGEEINLCLEKIKITRITIFTEEFNICAQTSSLNCVFSVTICGNCASQMANGRIETFILYL